MKKILSFFMVVAMTVSLFSVCAFANTASPTIKAKIDGYTGEVGSTFTVTFSYEGITGLSSTNETENFPDKGIQLIQFNYKIPGYGEFFKFGKATASASFSDKIGSATKNIDTTNGEAIYAKCWGTPFEYYYTGSGNIAVLTLKVLKAPTSDVNFALNSAKIEVITLNEADNDNGYELGGQDNYYQSNNTLKVDVDTIKVSSSTDVVIADETFADDKDGTFESSDVTSGNVVVDDKNIEMGTNGKVYTYFKKTTKALTSGEYGITATINGKTYKFPGKADVGENGKWAIKLVVPKGTFSDGTSVGTITNATPYGID